MKLEATSGPVWCGVWGKMRSQIFNYSNIQNIQLLKNKAGSPYVHKSSPSFEVQAQGIKSLPFHRGEKQMHEQLLWTSPAGSIERITDRMVKTASIGDNVISHWVHVGYAPAPGSLMSLPLLWAGPNFNGISRHRPQGLLRPGVYRYREATSPRARTCTAIK